MKLIIRGTPIAKQSFKLFKKPDGKFQSYPDPNVVQYRDSVKGQILSQLPPDWKIIEGPIVITYLEFSFPALKGFNRSLLQILKDGKSAIGKPNKPDLDNLLKSTGDALNTMVWRDDAQIVEIFRMRKVYGQPCITIEFYEITDLMGKYPIIPACRLTETPSSSNPSVLLQSRNGNLFWR